MITVELLDKTPQLAELTPEIKAAIALLSQNDENAVIAQRFSEHYSQLDANFLAATGIAKVGSEKTYDYVVRVGKELKKATEGAISKTEYDKIVAERDEALTAATDPDNYKRKYEDELKRAKKLETQLQTQNSEHQQALHGIKVDNAIDTVLKGMSVRTDVEPMLAKLAMEKALATVHGANPEFVEVDGKQVLQFRDGNGDVLLNDKNFQKPYTLEEMLAKELQPYNILAKAAPQQHGVGSQPPAGGAGSGTGSGAGGGAVVDVASARTQLEASKAITASLKQQGLTPGTQAYTVAEQKAWADNNVAALPVGDGIVTE